LREAHVTGRSARFAHTDVMRVMHALVHGDDDVRMGLPAFEHLTVEHASAAVALVFGWNGDGPRARIDPARTIHGFEAACVRLLEIARAGGQIAFATARPASLLTLYRAMASLAGAEGGDVLGATQSGPIDGSGRRIWWIDGVATLTDGESLLADDSAAAAEELLFVLPRPDLVVADRTFAGTALDSGLEVVAFADLDAVALAVAAWRGMAVRVVPLDERRPPQLYAPLLEVLTEVVEGSWAAPAPGTSRSPGAAGSR